jgi:ABC-type nitrate/sulfonate/bicarbonate transport system ATPase subunit
MFQEPRLLPWLGVLENISIPLEKAFGKEKAKARARDFLSLVSLEEKEKAFPAELSGGQAQRISMARAFAWSAPVLLMDEPFQSLDIPLRKSLMDLTLSLLEKEKRFLVMATHDPREAVYLGGRVIVLGRPGEGIVFDRVVDNRGGKRNYGSSGGAGLESEIINSLFDLESVVVP